MHTSKQSTSIELDKCNVFLVGENIIENQVKEGAHIEVEDILAIKKANMALTSGRPYGVLVCSSDFSSISDEARKLSASREIIGRTVAKALVVHNIASRLIVNAYMVMNRPVMKTKVFSSRETAIQWLSEVLEAKA